LRAAASFLAERRDEPLYAVCNALMEGEFGKSDWLLAYWTKERLFSVEARRVWVEPDIRPLPF
jgi:hypothetical protein